MSDKQKTELVKGLEIVDMDEVRLQDTTEFVELRKELAQDVADAKQAVEEECQCLLSTVARHLLTGVPVTVTERMRELGIEQQVAAMIQKACYVEKLLAKLRDPDDAESDSFNLPSLDDSL